MHSCRLTNAVQSPKSNVSQSDQAVHKPEFSDQQQPTLSDPHLPPKPAPKSIMIFDSDDEEAVLYQVDKIVDNTHAVPIKNDATENLINFNNYCTTIS